MLTETNNGGQASLTYQYDATGNIRSRQFGANTLTFTYDPAHKHAVKTVTVNGQVKTFVYDANGNMTTGFDFTDPANIASRTIAYNTENLPTQIKYTKGGNTATTTLAYDGDGVRGKKIVQRGNTTYYIGEHYKVAGGVPSLYIFSGNQRIAKITATDKHYFHQDHLGSSTTISNGSGSGVETAEYLPFGAMREHTGSAVSNYKYTGQELDPESGLYNYKARLYDPVLGRFITADAIVPDFADPQALNRYSYCHNNPLVYVDPSGHWDIFSAIFGGIIGGINAAIHGDNILQGIVTGAISGALYNFVGDMGLQGVKQVTMHAVAGAASGAIGAGLNGGDVGMGALIGGFSGGMAEVGGQYLFDEGGLLAGTVPRSSAEFASQLAGTTLIGGVTGGATSALFGGDFGQGFGQGAMTGAIGYLANTASHKIIKYVEGKVTTYGNQFEGKLTRLEEPFHQGEMTGASRHEYMNVATMRKGVYAMFSGDGGVATVVRINDYLSKAVATDHVLDVSSSAMGASFGGPPRISTIEHGTVIYFRKW